VGRRQGHHGRQRDVRRPLAHRHAQPGHQRLQLDDLARRRSDDGRTPSYVNQLGYDKDEFTIDGFLGNNVSSATVHLATATDTYLPGVMALAFDEGPPFASTPASVSGTARDGETLTADPGVWQGSTPITYAYQWRRCDANGANCVDIAGATGQSYALGTADVGSTVRVVVTATNAAGATASTSAQTGRVAATPPGQHLDALDRGNDARRRDAHRRPRRLDRDADHHVRVPVAPVRRERRELRRHRGRDGDDLQADAGRRRHDDARGRDRDERGGARRPRRPAPAARVDPGRAGQHGRPDHRRHGARRRDAHPRPGHCGRARRR
jgi:hypothetical protein